MNCLPRKRAIIHVAVTRIINKLEAILSSANVSPSTTSGEWGNDSKNTSILLLKENALKEMDNEIDKKRKKRSAVVDEILVEELEIVELEIAKYKGDPKELTFWGRFCKSTHVNN